MIVAIHQPHFLPWLGYFDRMRKADLFIVLDHVQFTRQNYQNRVKIKTVLGAQWLTVPVRQRAQSESILEKTVDDRENGSRRWGERTFHALREAYRQAPHFGLYAPFLEWSLRRRWEKLVELDLALIQYLMRVLRIETPLKRSSELGVAGKRSQLILDLCRTVGADTFLAGLGASRALLDQEAFERAGVRIVWQEFRHPRYEQYPDPLRFLEGLSALDLLFNCGPSSAEVLRGGEFAYAGYDEIEGTD